jgi:uncharacterized protein (TIGR02444 family)
LARQPGDLNHDNAFWRFSLAVYGQAEVAKECLALQDACGLDVNILLFCAWLGTRSVALEREDIEAALRAVAAWQDDVVRPLRAVRQRTKAPSGDEDFRASINDAEIKAEQIEQAMLFALSQQLQGRKSVESDAVAMNVRRYIEMKSRASSEGSAVHLIEAARRLASR